MLFRDFRRTVLWIPALICGVCGCLSSAYGHGDLHDLIADLDRQISRAPQDAELLLERASYLRQHGDLARARADLERAVRAEPDHPDGPFLRCLLDVDQERWDDALAAADALCERQPDSARGFALRSRIHRRQGRLVLAAEDVATLLRTDDSAELRWFMLLGSLWMQVERPADAVGVLAQAADRFGPIPSIEEARARAWAAQGKMAAAAACLERLHRSTPELAFRWWILEADLWATQGNGGREQQALLAAAAAIEELSERKRNSQPVQTLQRDITRRVRRPGES